MAIPLSISDATGAKNVDVNAAGEMLVSLRQTVGLSVGNSSTANLAASASFTGAAESTLGVASIQVSFKADQQCTIQVQQASEDPGVNWDVVDTYILPANTGDSRTIQATGASFRVVVTNNGGSATTFLRLGVALCPLVEAVPRALTSLGNLKIAIQETSITKPTYSAMVTFTPPATPTDMMIIEGSATKTIRVLRVEVNGTSTANSLNKIFIIKRSTADTTGTFVADAATPFDSGFAATTVNRVGHFTANPGALGTAVGTGMAGLVLCGVTATGGVNDRLVFAFGDIIGAPITLRGVAQCLAVNFNGAALPAGLVITITIYWTEEFGG
jgi:hypothetical protein